MKKILTRRSFQSLSLVLPLVAIWPGLARAEKKRGGTAAPTTPTDNCSLPLAKPTDNPGINLIIDRSKAPAALKKETGGIPWEKQKCEGCILYVKFDKPCGGENRGACALIPKKAVGADWWCSSWAKKA